MVHTSIQDVDEVHTKYDRVVQVGRIFPGLRCLLRCLSCTVSHFRIGTKDVREGWAGSEDVHKR